MESGNGAECPRVCRQPFTKGYPLLPIDGSSAILRDPELSQSVLSNHSIRDFL